MARTAGLALYERAMPLEDFPAEWREHINALADADVPPPAWRTIDRIAQVPSRAWFEWHWRRGMYPRDADSPPRMKHRLRAIVIARDGYLCGLCGGDVEPDDVHIDHILPRSLGGPDEIDNLQVTHSLCNMKKGNRI